MEKIMVPGNLEIKELFRRCPPTIKGFHKDKVFLVCHFILQRMRYLNEDCFFPGKDAPYYVPLSSEILKSWLGSNYAKIIEWMVYTGIILRDGSWKESKISQGYRFTDNYVVVGYKWVTVKHWPIKKRESKDGKINGEMSRWQKRVENCVGKWYDEGLKIDYERAVQALDSIYAESVLKANTMRRQRASIEVIKAAVRRNSWQYAIDELKAGNFRDFIPDDYGYRVHTAFSQLKREFRCMVTYNGEQLVEVDIKNSQLYFMVYLLNWRNWNIRGESDEKIRKIWKDITTSRIDNKHPYTHTIMFLKSLESQYSRGFQEHEFVMNVTEGTLYESIMEKLMLLARGTAKLSWYNKRDDVKKVLLMQLFADRREHANSLFNCNTMPVWKTFETLYPDIGKIIREVKADYFKNISMLLQRIESMAVFGVCEHLFRHYPDVPYFTIHDCIVTTERNALTVKAVMEKCITDFIGYAPKLEVKHWATYEKGLQSLLKAA